MNDRKNKKKIEKRGTDKSLHVSEKKLKKLTDCWRNLMQGIWKEYWGLVQNLWKEDFQCQVEQDGQLAKSIFSADQFCLQMPFWMI